LGITEEWARALKPDIIWASLSGYGRTGPERFRGAFDILSQARGGLMSITGDPAGPPMKAGNSYTDYHAGYNLVIGILAALRHRDRTGEGQLVDIALLDSIVPSLDGYPLWYSVAGEVVGRVGNDHPMNLPGYGIFRCSDGYMAIGGSQGPIWSRLAVAIGRDDLADAPDLHDPGWNAFADRAREAFVAWLTPRTRDEVRDVLDAARVPNDPVHDLGEIWEDEQLEARDMFVDYDYPPLGRIKAIGSPLKLSATPVSVWRMPPGPGEQTDAILREVLGYTDEQIAALAAEGIFVTY
jgi:formyl-CoA transferase